MPRRSWNIQLVNCPVPAGRLHVNRSNYCCDYSKAAYRKQPLDLVILSGLLSPDHAVSYGDAASPGYSYARFLATLDRRGVDALVLLVGSLTMDDDAAFAARLRRDRPSLRLLATGDICRFEPAETLARMPSLDAVILDFTSPSVTRYLAGERDLANVVARDDARPRFVPEREPVFAIAPPRHELFEQRRLRPALARTGRVAETLLSFGCPHACRFCVLESVPYTNRTLPSIRAELRYIEALGFREAYFCDATFGAVRDPTHELLDVMRTEHHLVWWAKTRVDLVDADLARRLAAAGCHTLTLGVETASDAVNRAFDKRITVEQTRRAFAVCREAGIRTLAHIILGMPGETRSSLDETLALVDQLDPFYVSLNVMEAWKYTTFGDVYRREHGEHPKHLPDATWFYPEKESLPLEVVLEARARGLREFYLSPRRWLRYATSIRTTYEAIKYVRDGYEVLRQVLGRE